MTRLIFFVLGFCACTSNAAIHHRTHSASQANTRQKNQNHPGTAHPSPYEPGRAKVDALLKALLKPNSRVDALLDRNPVFVSVYIDAPQGDIQVKRWEGGQYLQTLRKKLGSDFFRFPEKTSKNQNVSIFTPLVLKEHLSRYNYYAPCSCEDIEAALERGSDCTKAADKAKELEAHERAHRELNTVQGPRYWHYNVQDDWRNDCLFITNPNDGKVAHMLCTRVITDTEFYDPPSFPQFEENS